jgi:hypothetical protein
MTCSVQAKRPWSNGVPIYPYGSDAAWVVSDDGFGLFASGMFSDAMFDPPGLNKRGRTIKRV